MNVYRWLSRDLPGCFVTQQKVTQTPAMEAATSGSRAGLDSRLKVPGAQTQILAVVLLFNSATDLHLASGWCWANTCHG